MEWIKIEFDTMPKNEVLSANFTEGTYGYKEKVIGYLNFDGQMFSCEGDALLENCTHYIDIHVHDPVNL